MTTPRETQLLADIAEVEAKLAQRNGAAPNAAVARSFLQEMLKDKREALRTERFQHGS